MLEIFNGFMKSAAGFGLGIIVMFIPRIIELGFGIKHSSKMGWTCTVLGILIIIYYILIRLK